MAAHRLVVSSSARPGREAEYVDHYERVHMPHLLELPGMVRGRFFEVAEPAPLAPRVRYVVVYDLDCDDPAEIIAEIARRKARGGLRASDALDPDYSELYALVARFEQFARDGGAAPPPDCG